MKGAYNSIKHIMHNQNVNRFLSFYKYALWQYIKFFNLFPRQIKISHSIINIKNKRIAVQGGTKLFTQGLYDFNNMSLIKYLLMYHLKTFFDIGANIGVYSIIASEIKSSIVFSFEPHPYTYHLLTENIKLNSRQNVNLFNCALGDSTKIVKFLDRPGSSTNRILQENEFHNFIDVQCFRLSDISKMLNVIPDIIKIDIEGAEYELLKEGGDMLKLVKVIIVEISNNRHLIYNLLNINGFNGPFSIRFKNKQIISYSLDDLEDPIFISNDFLPKLNLFQLNMN